MRDVLVWGATILFLLAALHTVRVRRELYRLGGEIAVVERRLLEEIRDNDNLDLERARLRSPLAVLRHAREADIPLISAEGRR